MSVGEPRGFLRRLAGAVRRRARDGMGRFVEGGRTLAFRRSVRRLTGPATVPNAPDTFVVVCLVRDGVTYIDEFLRHYRALGARHMVILDNGSTDGTVERLAGEPDVTTLSTLKPYKIYKDIMKRHLVNRYGRHGWVLCVDIDELFEYPGRHALPMGQVLAYLNAKGYTAVLAHLLDMFPARGITEAPVQTSWRREHRFYDLNCLERHAYDAYYKGANISSTPSLEVFYGGIRSSKFQVNAFLSKHPLLFPSKGLHYENAHNVRGARVADFTAVLLHYKYAGDFVKYAQRIVAEKSFWAGSAEYQAYLTALDREAGLNLHTADSNELGNVDELVAKGFLITSKALETWAVEARG
jgi:hypothetical protein